MQTNGMLFVKNGSMRLRSLVCLVVSDNQSVTPPSLLVSCRLRCNSTPFRVVAFPWYAGIMLVCPMCRVHDFGVMDPLLLLMN